ncbi:16275_t:CDS:2, partial [Rhizophagus irregularis]
DSNNQSFDVPFPSVLEDTSKSGTSEEYDGFEEFEITAEKENKIWD